MIYKEALGVCLEGIFSLFSFFFILSLFILLIKTCLYFSYILPLFLFLSLFIYNTIVQCTINTYFVPSNLTCRIHTCILSHVCLYITIDTHK